MRIVAIGDSITAGQYLPSEQAWPQQLAALTGHEVLNAGISNETTRNGLERFSRDVQERSPDLVIIQFGLNDCNRWKTDRYLLRVLPASYRENLIEMVTRVRTFDAGPLICDLTPTLKSERHRLDRDHYRVIARRVAEDFKAPFVVAGDDLNDCLLDAIHLNAEGHRAFAGAVAGFLLSKFPRCLASAS